MTDRNLWTNQTKNHQRILQTKANPDIYMDARNTKTKNNNRLLNSKTRDEHKDSRCEIPIRNRMRYRSRVSNSKHYLSSGKFLQLILMKRIEPYFFKQVGEHLRRYCRTRQKFHQWVPNILGKYRNICSRSIASISRIKNTFLFNRVSNSQCNFSIESCADIITL